MNKMMTTVLALFALTGSGCSGVDAGGPSSTNELDENTSSSIAQSLTPDDGTHPVSVTSWGPNRLDVFYRGLDNGLYQKAWNGVSWVGPTILTQGLTSAPFTVATGTNSLSIFFRGADGHLLEGRWLNGQWTNALTDLGGIVDGGVTAGSAVFARLSDGYLYYSYGTARLARVNTSLPKFVGTPSAVSPLYLEPPPRVIDTTYQWVFFRGVDNQLCAAQGVLGLTQPFEQTYNLGGILTSSPSAVSWGPGRIDVFVRDTNGALRQISTSDQGHTWSGFANLGGGFTGDPVAVSRGVNLIDVFVHGSGDSLFVKSWNGTAWSGWSALGSALAASPAAVAWSSTRLDVLMKGTDGALKHKAWNQGGSWLPSPGFESLGGAIQ